MNEHLTPSAQELAMHDFITLFGAENYTDEAFELWLNE
jgi:hypothetical protein